MKQLLATASVLILATACGQSDKPAAPEPAETVAPAAPVVEADISNALLMPLPDATSADIVAGDLAVRIQTLADDAFEGRGPGTPVGEKTADWVAAEMERVGLKPGSDGSWFQTVKMVNQTVDEAASSITISVGEDAAPLELGTDAVIWTKRQSEGTISFADSDVVFVGYGAVAPEYGWNDYEGLDVAGKTVVIMVNDPGFATQDPDLFNGNAMTYYGRWVYKFEEAARQGATAAIVIHDTEPASYGWDVVSNSWTGAQADLVRPNDGADRVMLEGWISNETASRLFDEAGLDYEALTKAASQTGVAPVDMGDLTASGSITQTVEPSTSRNVLGMIEGSEAPGEYVMYTAHWDHLGKAETPADPKNFTFQEDKIYNGAVDNATGTAALLEIAEKMAAGDQPSRSVLFAAVTLEESGLLGSAYMAENPVVPNKDIVAGVNMDGMLPTGPSEDMIVVGYGASELEDLLAGVLTESGRTVTPDPVPQNGYFYRSDHVSYAKKGVPMLYADGGNTLRDGGIEAGKAAATDYTINRYHKPQDEYSADWDLSGMTEDITALYRVGATIANSTDWPTWYEGNEFKAIRDADRAGEE